MEQSRSDIALLILAAGAARRMGQAKQLLPWGETTLLGHTLEQARKVRLRRKYLLLGARSDHIMEEVDISGFIPLINPEWEEGMGNGIAFATHKILHDVSHLKGVMVMLADQPGVDAEMLADMLERFDASDKGLLACSYGDRTGVPAVVGGDFMEALTQLEGDKGARSLFVQHSKHLEVYPVDAPLEDIDDLATYLDLHKKYFGCSPS